MHDISKPRHARGFAFAAAHSARGAGDAPFPAFASSAAETWTLAIALGILYVAAIASFRSAGLLSDEAYHYAQIELFRRGEFRVLDLYLTTIPGYHALVATLLAITGSESLAAARTLTALFGLAAAAAFHLIRRETQRGTESIATAELLALPVLAPFLFLVYTDVLALALILWATLATLRGRHVLAAIALCATVLVRQNDVVWAGFLAALAVWPAWQERGFADPKRLAALLAPYLVPVGAFLAFWIWNGSISLSHEQAKLHPELGLHTGNLLLAVLAVGVLCGVQVNACTRRFIAMARTRRWLFAVFPVVVVLFWLGFRASNPYNAAMPEFFVHNAIVQAIVLDPGWRFVAALFAAVGACILIATPLRPAGASWLFPIAVFFFASEWLVETRYLIVPFALWLALREIRSKRIEYAMLALWVPCAVLICAATLSGRVFP